MDLRRERAVMVPEYNKGLLMLGGLALVVGAAITAVLWLIFG